MDPLSVLTYGAGSGFHVSQPPLLTCLHDRHAGVAGCTKDCDWLASKLLLRVLINEHVIPTPVNGFHRKVALLVELDELRFVHESQLRRRRQLRRSCHDEALQLRVGSRYRPVVGSTGPLGIIKGVAVKGCGVIFIWDLNMTKFQAAMIRHHWP